MTETQKIELIDQGIETWGEEAQIEMLMEESIELSLATRKFLREMGKGREEKQNTRYHDLCGEIADVEIMIKQFKRMFLGSEALIHEYENMKWARLRDRLNDPELVKP